MVRLAYAGESTTERRRVVKEEGKDDRDKENGIEETGFGAEDVDGVDGEPAAANASCSALRSFPMPMYS